MVLYRLTDTSNNDDYFEILVEYQALADLMTKIPAC
jgi:hypothetical protein